MSDFAKVSGSSEATAITDSSPIMAGGEAEKAADFANYFCSYAYLYHQKQMLMDHVRMKAYHSAIMSNKAQFQGKTVLDVGTGSGVLAMWCAQAGAAKVYAVEYTDMANHARRLVEGNGLSGVVEVIQSSVEELELPCKVDIIISEWMGYMLLRESMLDSVIRARDRWLKPTGAMFPSKATMLWSAVSYEEDQDEKVDQLKRSLNEYEKFSQEMSKFYNINVGPLDEAFHKEQKDYYIYSSLWTELRQQHVIGDPCVIKTLDLQTCTLEDASDVKPVAFSINIPFAVQVSGYAGWFTVDFAGSEGTPLTRCITLSTGPEAGYTHWGQQVFYFQEGINCTPDTRLHGELSMFRQEKNKRLYNVKFSMQVDDEAATEATYEIP